jgi:hypothetical protein
LARGAGTECDHRAGRVGTAQCVEGSPSRRRVVDDDGGQRLAERRLDGWLPSGVDLDQVEQRAEHPVDTCESLGTGAGSCGVEREFERLDTRGPAGCLLGRVVAQRLTGLVHRRRLHERRFGQLDFGDQRLFDRAGLVAVGTEPDRAFGTGVPLGRERVEPFPEAPQVAGGAFERRPHRTQFAPNFGRGAGGLRAALIGTDRFHHLRSFDAEALLVGDQRLGRRLDLGERGDHVVEFRTEPSGVRLEIGDHAGVQQLALVALERSSTFDQDGGQPACALSKLLDAHQAVADVARAPCRQLGLDRHHLGVERGESRLQLGLRCGTLEPGHGERFELGPPRRDLTTRHVGLHLGEFGDERPVALGRLGLAFQRAQLATHLAQQVLDAQEVGLGGVEPAFGLLLALAELEHAGGFLDDRSPFLGTGIEHGVDLTLADDHVLLASDTRIGQQLLHVEQAARDTVDGVFRVAGAEQHPGDGDLAQFDAERAVGVVDGDAHFGAPQCRARCGTGEDDVVHLLAAHRFRGLGAEHPCDRVDDVRLAGTVGADDDGHTGFEHHAWCCRRTT